MCLNKRNTGTCKFGVRCNFRHQTEMPKNMKQGYGMYGNQQQGYGRGYGRDGRTGYHQSGRDRWENRNRYNRTNQTQWGRTQYTPSQRRDNMGVNEREQCPPHFLEKIRRLEERMEHMEHMERWSWKNAKGQKKRE